MGHDYHFLGLLGDFSPNTPADYMRGLTYLMVSGREEPHTHFLPLLFVLTSLRSPLPSRINCSACGYSSKEDLDKMTQGHRHSNKNQARPLLRISKSMCRFTNLSHWRARCPHNIAYNCFVGRGLVLGLTHRYLHMSLGVYIIAFLEYLDRQEKSSLRVLRI